jgi:hypothetical protein
VNLTSELVVAITSVVSAVIALAALGLGIFNYRQARRRDTFQLRAAVRTMNSRLQDGTLEASDLEVELTNVGQRPVTVTDVALVWRRRGLWGRLARRGWRLRRRRSYQWHQRLQYGGLRLRTWQVRCGTWLEDRPRGRGAASWSRPSAAPQPAWGGRACHSPPTEGSAFARASCQTCPLAQGHPSR